MTTARRRRLPALGLAGGIVAAGVASAALSGANAADSDQPPPGSDAERQAAMLANLEAISGESRPEDDHQDAALLEGQEQEPTEIEGETIPGDDLAPRPLADEDAP